MRKISVTFFSNIYALFWPNMHLEIDPQKIIIIILSSKTYSTNLELWSQEANIIIKKGNSQILFLIGQNRVLHLKLLT